MFRAVFILLLYSWMLTSPAFAKPETKITLSSDKIALQETTTLRIEAEWLQNEGPYLFALPRLKIEKLELTNQAESQESFFKGEDAWIRKVFIYEFTGALKGKTELQKLSIPYVQPETREVGSFETPHFTIEVTPRPLPWNKIAIGIGAIAGFGAIIVFLIMRKKRKAEPAKEEVPAYTIEAEQKVTQLLNLRGQSPSKTIIFDLSKTFRDFLVRQFHIEKRTATEDELVELLKSQNLTHDELKKISDLVARVREAKYIGERISESDVKYLGEDILHFIHSKQVVGNAG